MRIISPLVAATCLVLAACVPSEPASSVRWSDGDSGTIDGTRFRLADVDAPETGPIGSATGAACEQERQGGEAAQRFMQDLTRGAELQVRTFETDRYGRIVIGLEANGVNVANAGLAAGHLQSWPHFDGRADGPKPDWCR